MRLLPVAQVCCLWVSLSEAASLVFDVLHTRRPDEPCGSGWNVWIGKKDPSSSHFLDRNGLGVNQGRIYRFVADSGETDMATLVDWPASGKPGYAWTDKMGKLEPIDHMFNGICAPTRSPHPHRRRRS